MRGGRSLLRTGIASLTLACIVTAGCKIVPKITGSEKEAEAQTQRIQALQGQTMRFADEYVGRLVDATYGTERRALDPRQRLSVHNWVISQTTSAYTSASGPNPVANALDMVVLATLSRRVMEDAWVEERFGGKAELLRRAHAQLEPRAWTLIEEVTTQEQRTTLRRAIEDWHARNPEVVGVAFIHFHDFAKLMGQRGAGAAKTPGSLFGLLGLDPLSDLDPAVREIEQTRHLAERAIYYLQRMPTMIDMQVERLALDIALLPDTQRLLAGVDRASVAAESAGKLMNQLPEVIAREREATIAQIMDALYAQEAKVRELAAQLRGTLEAGTATSDSLNATIESLDGLMARFQSTRASGVANSEPGLTTGADVPAKPFDIAEYTEALHELGATARELQSLVKAIDSGVPAITGAAQTATDALIDKLFWNLLLLALIVIAAAFAAAIGYRVIRRRMDAPG